MVNNPHQSTMPATQYSPTNAALTLDFHQTAIPLPNTLFGLSTKQRSTDSGVERGQGGGAIAPGPGPVVGARVKLDFLFVLIGSQWGIQGGGVQG